MKFQRFPLLSQRPAKLAGSWPAEGQPVPIEKSIGNHGFPTIFIGVRERRQPCSHEMRIPRTRSGLAGSGLSSVDNGTPLLAKLFAKNVTFLPTRAPRMRHSVALPCVRLPTFVSSAPCALALCKECLLNCSGPFSSPECNRINYDTFGGIKHIFAK